MKKRKGRPEGKVSAQCWEAHWRDKGRGGGELRLRFMCNGQSGFCPGEFPGGKMRFDLCFSRSSGQYGKAAGLSQEWRREAA
jgi:hypothetical protein